MLAILCSLSYNLIIVQESVQVWRFAMEAVAYSTFRKDLRAYLDKTRDDATPLLVTSKDPSANVVVMNAMDYDNLIENLEVQSNARLMSKIERGMKQFAEERGANHELIEVEDA